jgi:hypothetical protein
MGRVAALSRGTVEASPCGNKNGGTRDLRSDWLSAVLRLRVHFGAVSRLALPVREKPGPAPPRLYGAGWGRAPSVSPFGRGAQRATLRCASNAADGRCPPASGTTQSPGPEQSRRLAEPHDLTAATAAASGRRDRYSATTTRAARRDCARPRSTAGPRRRPVRRLARRALILASVTVHQRDELGRLRLDRGATRAPERRRAHGRFQVAWSANPSNC